MSSPAPSPLPRAPFRAALPLALALFLGPAPAARATGHDGQALLRMCQGADKVKALSMMCHSYLNGYLDTAAWQAGGKGPKHCLTGGDKEDAPAKLVLWLRAHPKALGRPAPEALEQAFADLFPCRR